MDKIGRQNACGTSQDLVKVQRSPVENIQEYVFRHRRFQLAPPKAPRSVRILRIQRDIGLDERLAEAITAMELSCTNTQNRTESLVALSLTVCL